MAKWIMQVMFTGYLDIEVEADSYKEAAEEVMKIADPHDVDGWYSEIEDYWRKRED